jgi:hypothetical protein
MLALVGYNDCLRDGIKYIIWCSIFSYAAMVRVN